MVQAFSQSVNITVMHDPDCYTHGIVPAIRATSVGHDGCSDRRDMWFHGSQQRSPEGFGSVKSFFVVKQPYTYMYAYA
jgi:hypothetical protein